MSNLWCGDETAIGQLIMLTAENLVVANPNDEDLPSIRERLTAGESAVAVLGSKAHVISLVSIEKVSTNRHEEDIEIKFSRGKETKDITLWLKTQQKRDEVFAALKAVSANQFQETEVALNRPRAAFGSFMALTVFGALTLGGARAAVLFRDASDYDVDGRRAGLKILIAWVLEKLGPTGVYVIGGLLCLLATLTLASRIKQPPVIQVLQAGPYKVGSAAGLTLGGLAWTIHEGSRGLPFCGGAARRCGAKVVAVATT